MRDETDTILNSVVVKLRGENYNETLEWCFSIDKVSESGDRVVRSQLNKKIKDMFIELLTRDMVEFTDIDGIDDFLNDLKDSGDSYLNVFKTSDEELMIIAFNVLLDMFYDIWLATESVDDIYDHINFGNKDISEIRFQLFTELKVNFSMDKLFNGCLCVLIILFYSNLTADQKNKMGKEKIGEIEKFKSLILNL